MIGTQIHANPSSSPSSSHHQYSMDGEVQPPADTTLKNASDKTRRDEWSESGVVSLLQAYESKWSLRNRAKLKGTDWEEIARQVSFRCSGSKSSKTPNQCKNKIESMKKRYRAESASTMQSHPSSTWQFYSRMDGLLKGTNNNNNNTSCSLQPRSLLKVESNHEADDGSNTLPNNGDDVVEKKHTSDVSTQGKRLKKRRKSEVVESIMLLGQSMLKIEEMRMEVWKDMERLRAEAEIKRGEMELKRTEIIAETQLQIARLFSRMSGEKRNNKSQSSSSARSEPDVLRRDGKEN